jgi:hypothetical protein
MATHFKGEVFKWEIKKPKRLVCSAMAYGNVKKKKKKYSL